MLILESLSFTKLLEKPLDKFLEQCIWRSVFPKQSLEMSCKMTVPKTFFKKTFGDGVRFWWMQTK